MCIQWVWLNIGCDYIVYDYFRCYCIGFDYIGILLYWLWLYCLWLYRMWLQYMTILDVTVLAITKLSVNTLVATYKHALLFLLNVSDINWFWLYWISQYGLQLYKAHPYNDSDCRIYAVSSLSLTNRLK